MSGEEDFEDDGEWEVVYNEGADADAAAADDEAGFTTVNLPTLTVRRLLTEEQMVEKDPYFVAMSDAEVAEGVYEFVQDHGPNGKVDGFVRTWKGVLAALRPADVPPHVTLWVDAAYKPMEESEAMMAEAERIAAILSLRQRESEWSKYYFPLAPAPAALGAPTHAFAERAVVLFGDGTPASIPLLPADAAHLAIKGFAVDMRPLAVRYATLADALAAPEPAPAPEPPVARLLTATEGRRWRTVVAQEARARQRAAFDEWLADVDDLADLHDIATALARRGIDFDTITPFQLDNLRKKMEDIGGHVKPRGRAHAHARQRKAPAALPAPFAPMAPIVSALKRCVAADRHPLPPLLDPPTVMTPVDYNPLTLFEAIANAEGDPKQLMEVYRDYDQTLRRATDKAFLDAAAWWEAAGEEEAEAAEEAKAEAVKDLVAAVDQVTADMARCNESVHLENDFSGIALEVEMAQIKRGRDLAHYSGELEEATMVASLPAADDEAADEAAAADVADEAGAGPSAPPPMPAWPDATPGQAEILDVVAPILARIAARTRLPFDAHALAVTVIPHLHWASRRTLLLQSLPNVLEADINAFLQNEAYADTYAEGLAHEPQRALLRRAVREVQTAFKRALYDGLDLAFAWWATTLQDAFAEHRLLDYVPPEGTCVAFWGFHGPPMTNTQGRGVLMYLLCCFQLETAAAPAFLEYLGGGRGAEGRVATVAGVAAALLPDHVARIKAAYAGLTPFLMKQREALKEEQNALRRLFADARALHKYVGALLQLPKWTVLQQTALPGRLGNGRGCCAQNLDARYRAYGNWDSKLLKPLVREMAAYRKGRGDARASLWGVWKPVLVEASAPAAAAAACAHVKERAEQAPAAPAPAAFDDLHARLAPWAAGGAKAAAARLQLLAKFTRQSAATAAMWMQKMDAATADDLVALATRLLKVISGTKAGALTERWLAARDALLATRTATAAADEQAVLADIKSVVTSIALLPRESSADGTAWSLPADVDADAAADRHGAAVAVLNGFMGQMDRTAAYLQDHINELRERQKAKLLAELNSRDAEMRALLTQMGRIGIVKLSDPNLPGGRADDDAFGGIEMGDTGVDAADREDRDAGVDENDGAGDEEGYTDTYAGADADGNDEALD